MSVDRCDQGLVTNDLGSSGASMTNVAGRVKLIRETFGISQRELAKRAGVTNSSISMIELGQVSPSIQMLERIISVFSIEMTDFFCFTGTSSVRVGRSSNPATAIEKGSDSHGHDQLIGSLVIIPPGKADRLKIFGKDACGVILQGRAQLKSVTAKELLGDGDWFYIPARQLHCFVNHGEAPLRIFMCTLSTLS